MKRCIRLLTLPIAVIIVLFQPHCTKKEENPVTPAETPRLELGPSVQLANQVVPASGGTITVNSPGDPLNGLTLEVPAGAYRESRTFDISYVPITKHQFGSTFNPVTPLIKIRNGGGFSQELMKLRIPCRIPQGHHAMAFPV